MKKLDILIVLLVIGGTIGSLLCSGKLGDASWISSVSYSEYNCLFLVANILAILTKVGYVLVIVRVIIKIQQWMRSKKAIKHNYNPKLTNSNPDK
ncbi:MAG TPA: hypothetical protein PKD52_09590 [Clostridiales bacterium]|nr:hypothetical protein [Clostridiales bacterium]